MLMFIRKQILTIKCALLIKKNLGTIPCLRELQMHDIGIIHLKRKLSILPMENILILENQLNQIQNLEYSI